MVENVGPFQEVVGFSALEGPSFCVIFMTYDLVESKGTRGFDVVLPDDQTGTYGSMDEIRIYRTNGSLIEVLDQNVSDTYLDDQTLPFITCSGSQEDPTILSARGDKLSSLFNHSADVVGSFDVRDGTTVLLEVDLPGQCGFTNDPVRPSLISRRGYKP